MPLSNNPKTGQLSIDRVRYFAMRPDLLMNAVYRLSPSGREEFLNALCQAAEKYGGSSIEEYAREAPNDPEKLLRRTVAAATALGWGLWKFDSEPAAVRAGTLISLSVVNSPFTLGDQASDRPMCTPIIGILRSLMLQTYARAANVVEVQCKAQGQDSCLFTVEFGELP